MKAHLGMLLLLLAGASGAWAQESRSGAWLIPADLSGNGELEPSVPAQGAKGKVHRTSLGLKMEYWEAALEVTDSSNNAGDPASDVERGLDYRVIHASTLLAFDYGYHGMKDGAILAHVGLGLERLGSHQEANLSYEYGDYDFDVVYESGFAFEIGAGYRQVFSQVDAGVSFLFRMGGGDRDYSDGPEEYTYNYRLIRIGGELGFRAAEGVRPYLGIRYTLYAAEHEFSDTGFDLSYDFEYDQPFGVSIGVELESATLRGVLEILFVDVEDAGFLISLGGRF